MPAHDILINTLKMDVGTPLKFNNQGEGAAILGLFGVANIFKQDFLGMDRRVIRRKFGME